MGIGARILSGTSVRLMGAEVTMVCDMNQQNLKKVKKAYPQINVTDNFDELIKNPEVDAIAIATPVFTHHESG